MSQTLSEFWTVITGACTAAVSFAAYTVRGIHRLDRDKVSRDELDKVITEMRADRKDAQESRQKLHEKFDKQADVNMEVARYLGKRNGSDV